MFKQTEPLLLAHARAHLRTFFAWYNHQHRHSGIGFMTPSAVHYGQANAIHAQRAQVLEAAYRAHPERFKRKMPIPPALPEIVGINLPNTTTKTENTHDLRTSTSELLTKFSNQVSQIH